MARRSPISGLAMKGVNYWRERWLHEDDLINHRLTWLLVAQAILFSGYATLLDLLFDTQKSLQGETRKLVLDIVRRVFPWVGIGIAIIIGIGIVGALTAMFFIHRYANKESRNSFEYGIHWLPSILGQISGISLPVLFALVWLYLACVADQFA
jgi:hypothetical protein